MNRNEEIVITYFNLLDKHLDELTNGTETTMLELNQIATLLNLSHKKLITIVRTSLGNHPCHFYDQKILDKAKQLLIESDWPVAKIALRLTYDPSNFSKFFKKYTGITPGTFREHHRDDTKIIREKAKSSP
jgi:AraC family transcriptional regulator, regulatory protein of adaptative response / methylphosphotriester-DNA alkyltransferase methyltransferase